MSNFMLRQDSAGEADAGAPKETPPPQPTPTEAPKEAGGNFDDLGYSIPPKADAAAEKAPEPEKAAPPPEEKKIDPATGYGEKPPKAAEEPAAAAPEPPKVELGYELDVKDVDPKEALKLQEFAKSTGLTKEAAQALVNLRKSEMAEAKKAQEEAKAAQIKAIEQVKSTWYNELKTDSTFGGDKFAHNVLQVEKFVDEFMPNTKKILTERGSMLPPYVMRDLAKAAERFYKPENLVQGSASVPAKTEVEDKNDHLSFYT